MSITYARNCDEITISRFTKIAEKGDYRYLVINWDGFGDIEVDLEKADALWKDIYNEYCKLTDDNKVIFYYDVLQTLNKLRAKQYAANVLLHIAESVGDFKILAAYFKAIKNLGFNVHIENGVAQEIARIKGRVAFMDNAIRIKELELEGLRGDQADYSPLMEQIVKVENHLRREVDPEKTSVTKWIYIVKSISNGK